MFMRYFTVRRLASAQPVTWISVRVAYTWHSSGQYDMNFGEFSGSRLGPASLIDAMWSIERMRGLCLPDWRPSIGSVVHHPNIPRIQDCHPSQNASATGAWSAAFQGTALRFVSACGFSSYAHLCAAHQTDFRCARAAYSTQRRSCRYHETAQLHIARHNEQNTWRASSHFPCLTDTEIPIKEGQEMVVQHQRVEPQCSVSLLLSHL